MQKLSINAYKVQELDGKPRETALDWLREVQTSDDWFAYLVEDWKGKLEAKGYQNPDIQFSGFWSQGDGTSFTATLDMQTICKRFKSKLKAEDMTGKIVRGTSHYVHDLTIDAEINHDADENCQSLIEDLEFKVTEDARSLSRQIYKALDEEHEYRTSEPSLLETADANEYLFDKYGSPIHHLISK